MQYIQNPWFLVVLMCVVALAVTRFGWRRVLIGKPSIRLIELGSIRVDPASWDMIDHASKEPGVRRIQFTDGDTSVIYTWSDAAETLDVSVPGKAGIIVTWKNEWAERRIARLTHIGGNEYLFPNVSLPERSPPSGCCTASARSCVRIGHECARNRRPAIVIAGLHATLAA